MLDIKDNNNDKGIYMHEQKPIDKSGQMLLFTVEA